MKRMKISNILAVLCTLLLVAAGACLPQVVSRLLDRRLWRETTKREDAYVSLLLSQTPDLFRTLELFRTQHSEILLSEGYRMTEQEVKDAAAGALTEFLTPSLQEDGAVYVHPKVTPVLLTGGEAPALSGVFWHCVWEDGIGEDEVLWLDDESGKMVAYQGYLRQPTFVESEYLIAYAVGTPEDAARQVAEFCRRYYPVDDVQLALEKTDVDGERYSLVLSKGSDGRTETCSVPLGLRDGWISFNF